MATRRRAGESRFGLKSVIRRLTALIVYGERVDASQDWTAPGPETVAPGVHRIPLPMPNDGLRAVNVYAIEDGTGVTMIDGGWALAEARTELEKGLDTLGYGLASINRFLVTHAHRDHYTLAVVLRQEFGTPIGLGAGERPAIEAILGATSRLAAQIRLIRQGGADELAALLGTVESRTDPVTQGWAEPDEWLDAGLVRVADRQLRVVPTPGHTRGHIVFADDAAGLLFAGDHVLPHITPSIGFEPVPADGPLSDYLDSLALIRTMPDLELLPAHGGVARSTHARVDELVAHHDNRLRETAEATIALGEATAAQVAASLGWTRRRRAFRDLDQFNQMLAVIETIAHLRVLVRSGILDAAGDDIIIYSAHR
jgi:glyoxylase-like metal-dependent hydrolase (beta-lactamase superfamily II)